MFALLLTYSSVCFCQNHALQLNGTSEYINVPDHDSLDISENQTLEALVKLSSTQNLNVIARKGWCNGSDEGYYLGVKNGKIIWLWAERGNCDYNSIAESTDSVIPNDICTHIAIVHKADTVLMYVDGIKVKSTLIKGKYSKIRNSSSSMTVGAYQWKPGGYGAYLNGTLDEFRIWNMERSATQIATFRNQELNGTENGLVLYFPMNDTISGRQVQIKNISDIGSPLNGQMIGLTQPNPMVRGCRLLSSPTGFKPVLARAYPNPAHDAVWIETIELNNDAVIRLTDSKGAMIMTSRTTNGNRHWINLESYDSGIYVITIQSDKQLYTAKIMKL
jgi:hypothetical protein